ncbi:hypothetical protein FSARC_11642 [Fusarium sarcochroum]|uniref:Major facilitator superfamily (MFS) profile domain-containing protein n=1 Tax=Fusarium sarcochroum TaxID=1208366 RepID=A0A8H4TE58_9HYPO|nr:hypothetical protein FSARC_11642 [Fusarium sarcochroum]
MESFLQFRHLGRAAEANVRRGHERLEQIVAEQPKNTRSLNRTAFETRNPAPLTNEPETCHPPSEKLGGGTSTTDPAISTLSNIKTDRDLEAASPAKPSDMTTATSSNDIGLASSIAGVHIRGVSPSAATDSDNAESIFIVSWEDADDPLNPKNWSVAKWVLVTLQVGLISTAVGGASGIDATALPQAAKDFGVSEVAESLATGLYLIGIGVGSLCAGPFSETFGRNPVYIGSMLIFSIWIMGAALSPNLGAQLAFRFLAGCCGSTPIFCCGGSVADLWNSLEKTWSFPVYTTFGFGGSILGAIIGTIFLHRLRVSMTRPFLMMTEPIILAMTLYITVLYIILFTFLVGWPYVFEKTYEINQGLCNTIFVAMFIGMQFIYLLVPFIYRKTAHAIKVVESPELSKRLKFSPELRLWYAMLGTSMAIPASLFWMGWTSSPDISIWSPIIASSLFGFGTTGVFIYTYLYIIDSYEAYSASALTFASLVRYIATGGMTIVSIPFYENMGTNYTLTIMACLSLVLVPIPYILHKYGHRLREKSKYAVNWD